MATQIAVAVAVVALRTPKEFLDKTQVEEV